jgi:hypothetical protein
MSVPKDIQRKIVESLEFKARGEIELFIKARIEVAQMYEKMNMFEVAAAHYEFAARSDIRLKIDVVRCRKLADCPPVRKMARIM